MMPHVRKYMLKMTYRSVTCFAKEMNIAAGLVFIAEVIVKLRYTVRIETTQRTKFSSHRKIEA